MNNNSGLPEDLSVPYDMAKRISESMNKKPFAPKDELQNALEEMARDITLIGSR